MHVLAYRSRTSIHAVEGHHQIVRHRLICSTYSPDDPTLQDYWRQRRAKPQVTTHRQRQLAQRQQGQCPVCHQHLDNGEDLHVHHVVSKKHGGMDDLVNLRLVHHMCHRQIHSSSAPLGVRRLLEPSYEATGMRGSEGAG